MEEYLGNIGTERIEGAQGNRGWRKHEGIGN